MSDPWVGKIPCKRAWQPIPVFFPGEFHGQRSLAGYSPWGRKESDMTGRPAHTRTDSYLLDDFSTTSDNQKCVQILESVRWGKISTEGEPLS